MRINVSVILPESYRGGTLRGALNVTRMLAIGSRECGDELDLSFGHVDAPHVYASEDFTELRKLGVRVRPFLLEKVPGSMLDPIYDSILNIPRSERSSEYASFSDGISNFEDSDFWLIISDRLNACIPPHRRYAVVIYDYIQRFIPEIFGTDSLSDSNWLRFEKYAEIARKAEFVLCTTQQTRLDCITYIGVQSEKAIKFPQEFDPVGENVNDHRDLSESDECPYIIWTTNSTQHKNHINVVKGLELYFAANPTSQLMVRVTGVYTHLFDEGIGKNDPHFNIPYIVEVRAAITATKFLRERLKILGNLEDQEYLRQLRNASWLLHGAYYDNGTFSIVEAAWFGVPSISSNYPAIRECCENFGLDVALFDPYSPDDLCKVMHEALPKRDSLIEKLPSRDRLARRSFSKIAKDYWEVFKGAISGPKIL